jgi:hypothetical protein
MVSLSVACKEIAYPAAGGDGPVSAAGRTPAASVTDTDTVASPLIRAEGGCLLCAVGHQNVPADAADRVSRALRRTSGE